jgi:hypothetical protein
MALKLWEMDERLEAMIYEATDRETGEIDEQALFDIDHLELDRELMILGLAGYIKGERSEADAVQLQADALTERAKSHKRRADRLQAYVERHLPQGESIRDDRHWLKWTKSSAVEITDESKLPSEFMTEPVTPAPRPDKIKLRQALKTEAVPGAAMVQRQKLHVK